MLNESDILNEFEHLYNNYKLYHDSALKIISPNKNDSEYIKIAIMGFSKNSKSLNWNINHFNLIENYFKEYIECGICEIEIKFSLLAVGSMLGLYFENKIDDRLYKYSIILLPGFVMGKGDITYIEIAQQVDAPEPATMVSPALQTPHRPAR